MADRVKVKLGVYGTLKNGYHGHYRLKDAKSCGTHMAEGFLLHLDAYPGLVIPAPEMEFMKGNRVPVEIYEVTQEVINELDSYESHPILFERRLVKDTPHGDYWIYYKHTDYLYTMRQRVIMDGRWKGPTSPYLVVDFFKNEKPKILTGKRKQLLPVNGGGYQEVDYVEVSTVKHVVNEALKSVEVIPPAAPKVEPVMKYIWSQVNQCYLDENGKKFRIKPWELGDGNKQTYIEIVEPPLEPPSTITIPESKNVLTDIMPKVGVL